MRKKVITDCQNHQSQRRCVIVKAYDPPLLQGLRSIRWLHHHSKRFGYAPDGRMSPDLDFDDCELFLALSATSAEIDIIEIRPTLWKRRRDHLSAHSDELSEMDSVDPRTYFGLPEKMTDDASAAFDLGEVKFL
ncbi:hypothetical protein MRX96_020168 [Rhipicephalus microplus]